jgi:hypothetical protein
LYVIDFTRALNFGEAQEINIQPPALSASDKQAVRDAERAAALAIK